MKEATKALKSAAASRAAGKANGDPQCLPIIAVDTPVMYEDEGQEQMGETQVHNSTTDIVFYGVSAHLADQPRYRVFSNLNCFYHRIDRRAYFSADVMVVKPVRRLPPTIRSYRISEHRPAPVLTVEVLSRRSFQQQDLSNKLDIYSDVRVPEYLLADMTGEFLPQRLLLKRLRAGGTWSDEQDPDGGVTSRLGFRLIIDRDGEIRVLDAATGNRYIRPKEAEAEAAGRRQAEERIRTLEAELARLRGTVPEAQRSTGKRKP